MPVRAPRNFTLTPEMAGVRTRSRPAMTLFPAFRLASALSSLLFVLVVLGDLLVSSPFSAARQAVVEGGAGEALDGLVEVEHSKVDRRIVQLRSTAQAKSLLRQAPRPWSGPVLEALQTMDQSTLDALQEGLEQLLDSLTPPRSQLR